MNMIKKTQYKFIAITLSSITLVLILILGMLDVCILGVTLYDANMNIKQIQERRGFIFSSDQLNGALYDDTDNKSDKFRNIPGKMEYMYVRINANNPSTPMITTNMSDTYTANDIYYIASALIKNGEKKGFYRNMLYEITDNELYTTVVIVNLSNDMNFMKNMVKLSAIIIICSLIIVFIFTYFFSKWAIRPLKTAFENQRRFISDASHELKTPLTAISANTDVLESEVGNNKWLMNIKSQTALMSDLVYDLLDLAKLDEITDSMEMKEFDLSSTVLSKTLEFECTAFENHKNFEENIKEGIMFKGDEDSIKHLISILIDNAIKHSNENGTIRVTLTSYGNKKIFQVYNTGNGIREDEKDKIFNRFYRSDKSRSKNTGGYGLGLSIAKSIAEANRGTISVNGEEGKWVSFTVVL